MGICRLRFDNYRAFYDVMSKDNCQCLKEAVTFEARKEKMAIAAQFPPDFRFPEVVRINRKGETERLCWISVSEDTETVLLAQA